MVKIRNMTKGWDKSRIYPILNPKGKCTYLNFFKLFLSFRKLKRKIPLSWILFWSISTFLKFILLLNIFITSEIIFAEEVKTPQVAPHLVPGYKNYFAEDSFRLQNMAYQNRLKGGPSVPQKPACSATLSPTAGSVFARCGTRSKTGNKSAKGSTIFGGKAFPNYDYLKNYIKFGTIEKTQGP